MSLPFKDLLLPVQRFDFVSETTVVSHHVIQFLQSLVQPILQDMHLLDHSVLVFQTSVDASGVLLLVDNLFLKNADAGVDAFQLILLLPNLELIEADTVLLLTDCMPLRALYALSVVLVIELNLVSLPSHH